MGEVAYARSHALLGALRSLSKKKYENSEPENAVPQKTRSENARCPRKRGVLENAGSHKAIL